MISLGEIICWLKLKAPCVRYCSTYRMRIRTNTVILDCPKGDCSACVGSHASLLNWGVLKLSQYPVKL